MKRDGWFGSSPCCECGHDTRTRGSELDHHRIVQEQPAPRPPRIPETQPWHLPMHDASSPPASVQKSQPPEEAARASFQATEEMAAVTLEKALDVLADNDSLLPKGDALEAIQVERVSVPLEVPEEKHREKAVSMAPGEEAIFQEDEESQTSPDVCLVPSMEPLNLAGLNSGRSFVAGSIEKEDDTLMSTPGGPKTEKYASSSKTMKGALSRSEWGTASLHSLRSTSPMGHKRRRRRRFLDPESACMRWSASCVRPVAGSRIFKVLLLFALLIALFGGSVSVCAGIPDDPGLLVLDIVMTAVMILFVFEISINVIIFRDEYPLSAFFWMDLLGTVSMVFEISFIAADVVRDMDTALLRAARAAKLGARGARFAKMVKLMSVITVGRDAVNNDKKKKSMSLEAANISNDLMLTLSTKVSILTIALVLVLPLFEPGLYAKQDYSLETWLLRLEDAYRMAYEEVSLAGNASYIFESVVVELDHFYASRLQHPYELSGFPESLTINGRQVLILGASLVLQPEPERYDYRLWREVESCRVERAGCEDGVKAALHLDIGKARKVEAGLNIVTIVFVMAVMVFMSFDLSKTLDVMLDIEKMAKMTKIFLKKNPVEDEDLKDMSNEDKGVIAMMKGSNNVEYGIPVGLKSFAIAHSDSGELPVVDELPTRANLIDSWELNMLKFSLEKQTLIILHMFFDSDLGRLSVRRCTELDTFMRFHRAVKGGYMDLPYHNYAHACDVSHTVYRLLWETQALEWTSTVEMHALLVSALCHDLGHTGRTNPFIVELGGELALRYNDKSPLENMHCARLFEICSKSDQNVFGKLDKDAYKRARTVCIAAILHTDNAHHFDMVKDLNVIYEGTLDVCNSQAQARDTILPEYREMVLTAHQMAFLQLFLHFADVSNPLKPFEVCRDWAWRVLDEFFAQGDAEKTLGVPVGMLNDREKVNRPGSQHGFINFLVSPLVLGTVKIFHPLLPLATQMVENLRHWHDMWALDSAPPEEDVMKREADIQKVHDVVRALEQRGGEKEKICRKTSLGRRSISGGRSSTSAFSMKVSRVL
mmetsp:Transcript_50230/g.113149  ORF Transcript_50230/g.113149 Transcript_50230/m.113149 type:complete len:1052 (-) Transcript_50230:26-3181(-)